MPLRRRAELDAHEVQNEAEREHDPQDKSHAVERVEERLSAPCPAIPPKPQSEKSIP